jgi:hypothetical protein
MKHLPEHEHAQTVRKRALRASTSPKVGWRVKEWHQAVGISRAWAWELIRRGDIKSVKRGHMRIITTTPTEYLSLSDGGTR